MVKRTSVPTEFLPGKGTQKPPVVPDGRYALSWKMGPVFFFKVNTPTEGKWAGFTFIDLQASDEFYPIKDKDRKREILEAIAEDPQKAAERYGQEIGACGICGRTLTNEVSRKRGIGPICAGERGW